MSGNCGGLPARKTAYNPLVGAPLHAVALRTRNLTTFAPTSSPSSKSSISARHLELRAGYGFPASGGRFTATLELALGLPNGRREYSLGWRLGLARSGAESLELRLEASRREDDNDADPEHGIGARW